MENDNMGTTQGSPQFTFVDSPPGSASSAVVLGPLVDSPAGDRVSITCHDKLGLSLRIPLIVLMSVWTVVGIALGISMGYQAYEVLSFLLR